MKTICAVIFLPFLIILLLVTPVNGAEDWVKYWVSPQGNIFSYNKVSLTHSTKDIVQVWEREVFSAEGRVRQIRLMEKMELSPEGYDKISHILISYEIDCKKKIFQKLSFTHYDTDNKVLLTHSPDQPGWNRIVTDSVMDSLREKVCK
jgi:uncharacterized protein YxeA